MALLDDEKKRHDQVTALPMGGRLVPGSGADKIATAIGGFKDRYQEKQAAAAAYAEGNKRRPAPQEPAAAPAPTVRPVFAGIDADPQGLHRRPAAPSSTVAKKSPVESTQSPASQPGVGAPVLAGGAAPRTDGVTVGRGQFGERTFTASGKSIADAQEANGAGVSSVAAQNFGSSVRPTIQGPAVASTFGIPVTDPRLNDQVQRPVVPNGISGASYRSADKMSEVYNSREDREARAKLLSDLDSQRFRLEMIAGNPGRRGRAALEALGQNAQQQAALIAAGEKLSADAAQGRDERQNALAIENLQQQGADRRTAVDAQVRQEGNQLDYQASITRPTADPRQIQLGDGTIGEYGEDRVFRPITTPDGQPVRAAQGKQAGQITPQDILKSLDQQEQALLQGAMTAGGVDTEALNQIRAQRAQLLGGGGDPGPVPDPATWIAEMQRRNAGKYTDAQLAAEYKRLYGAQ